MVRKQAAEVLDSLLTSSQKFRDVLEEGWLAAVLPMVNDREQSVQQMISKIVTKTVVNPLMRDTDATAWKMLHAIELENNNRRLLSRALMQEHQEGNIKPALVECLNRKLGSCPGEMDVIWMLLADLSAIFKVNPKKALEAWYAIEDGDPMNRVRYVTRVLSRSYAHLDSRARADLCADIKTKITGFRIDAMNIPSAYLCLAKLMDAVGEESTGKKNLQKVGKQLLNISRSHIRESLQKIDDEYDYPDRLEARETLLIRVITTIGEVVQFSPRLMNAGVRLFDALKSIVSSDIFNEHELPVINAAIPSVHPTPISSRAPSPTSTHSRAPSPTPSMVSSNQDDNPISSQNLPVIPHHILEDASTNRRALLTPRVRAHAVLTIGKFCLMDEKIGKSTIPVFVKQLKLNSDHVIRNNIALVICDLCIRYTSMVDRYSPIVAACLKDTSTLVRKQILQSLTSLIKEQFIRWEGQIMYRFVSTILDENKIIMEYTKFCLRDVLLLQFPELFSSHFIECLMYFNNVPVSCEREVVQEVVDPAYRVSLHGPENEENRMTIYKFMLSTFDDTHKFTLMAHICTQIICPVMNGKLKLEDPCVFALMRDSLTVMSLKEIKLNMDVGKGPDEEDEPPAVVVAAAKEMITETFRKAMIEYVMPALLDLRVYLNERRSSLRGPLYCVFRAICREHKEQIDAFLDGDQQLKAEVEYDIYRFEMREKAERAAAKKRAEEAAKERRRSRRSMAVVNRPPEEDDEDVTQRSGGPQAAPDVVNVQASEEAAGIKQEPVEQEEDVVMREVTPEPQAPTEHVTAEIVLTQCQDKQLGISVVCGDGQRMDELVAALHEVQAGTAPAASSAPTGEFVPTAAGSSTENMVASSSEAPKSPDMVMDAQPAPQFEVEPVKSTAACEPTEKENQHTVEENSLRRSVRLASTPSSTAAGTRLSRRATSSVSDESVLPSRAVSTPNKPISDLTFGDLNLSAIEGDAKRISRKPGRPRLSRKEMENIEEENSYLSLTNYVMVFVEKVSSDEFSESQDTTDGVSGSIYDVEIDALIERVDGGDDAVPGEDSDVFVGVSGHVSLLSDGREATPLMNATVTLEKAVGKEDEGFAKSDETSSGRHEESTVVPVEEEDTVVPMGSAGDVGVPSGGYGATYCVEPRANKEDAEDEASAQSDKMSATPREETMVNPVEPKVEEETTADGRPKLMMGDNVTPAEINDGSEKFSGKPDEPSNEASSSEEDVVKQVAAGSNEPAEGDVVYKGDAESLAAVLEIVNTKPAAKNAGHEEAAAIHDDAKENSAGEIIDDVGKQDGKAKGKIKSDLPVEKENREEESDGDLVTATPLRRSARLSSRVQMTPGSAPPQKKGRYMTYDEAATPYTARKTYGRPATKPTNEGKEKKQQKTAPAKKGKAATVVNK
nr:condensin-2 complex subunit D3-like [Haemonchus contortus]